MILVTFHGGDPSCTNIDNIYGYVESTIDSSTGQPTAYATVLSTDDPTVRLMTVRRRITSPRVSRRP
jgi:hypothetical protein